jgi:hypothetical protein
MTCREIYVWISSCKDNLYLVVASLWHEEYRQIWKHIFLGLQMKLCYLKLLTEMDANSNIFLKRSLQLLETPLVLRVSFDVHD